MGNSCKICCSVTKQLFKKTILGKYDGTYFQCISCGFLQIYDHPWLAESYSSAITSLDIGLVNRNLVFAPKVMVVIDFLLKSGEDKYLDYGGGYGMFVRLMRDKGYDFRLYDKYCENLFAASFECDINQQPQARFDLITAFEVFEHISEPLQELDVMLQFSSNIFFSTELQPKNQNKLDNWWYISPEIGQHISFYTIKSLRILAEKRNLNFYTDGKYFHLITKEKINSGTFRILTKNKISSSIWFFKPNRKSLQQKDYQMLLGKLKQSNDVNENII